MAWSVYDKYHMSELRIKNRSENFLYIIFILLLFFHLFRTLKLSSLQQSRIFLNQIQALLNFFRHPHKKKGTRKQKEEEQRLEVCTNECTVNH